MIEPHKFNEAHAGALAEPAYAKREVEFNAILARMCSSCDEAARRQLTPRFERFRQATLAFATDGHATKGMRMLYVAVPLARKIVRMVLQRLLDSLDRDVDIETTSHIPIEAMMLGTLR